MIATAALVVGAPLACLAGVAFYGKALTESDVAIGTLVSPEVARRRFAEARARFLAMSPAEHLAAARAALEAGAGPGRHRGGVGLALDHLAAIPEGAAEQAQVDALREEIARRRREAWRGVAAVVARRVAEQGDTAGVDGARLATMRGALAVALDARPPAGVGGVQVAGDGGVTLRLDRRRCDRSMLDAVIAPSGAALRALGFRDARCANDGGVLELQ